MCCVCCVCVFDWRDADVQDKAGLPGVDVCAHVARRLFAALVSGTGRQLVAQKVCAAVSDAKSLARVVHAAFEPLVVELLEALQPLATLAQVGRLVLLIIICCGFCIRSSSGTVTVFGFRAYIARLGATGYDAFLLGSGQRRAPRPTQRSAAAIGPHQPPRFAGQTDRV